jgi:hypothetical protein
VLGAGALIAATVLAVLVTANAVLLARLDQWEA